LALIGELFRIERQLAEASNEAREEVQRCESRLVVERFFVWGEATVAQALDAGEGLRYAINQRSARMRFLDDGRLPIHNNRSEQALRREAVGRKNWIFIGNDDAGAAFWSWRPRHGDEPSRRRTFSTDSPMTSSVTLRSPSLSRWLNPR
jgi:transposase